jgi:hypothetical protein
MTDIKVPKSPKSAYNPDRKASALLVSHIAHLEHALGLPEGAAKRWKEGAAARYIGALTARLTGQPAPEAAPKRAKPKPKGRKAKPKHK